MKKFLWLFLFLMFSTSCHPVSQRVTYDGRSFIVNTYFSSTSVSCVGYTNDLVYDESVKCDAAHLDDVKKSELKKGKLINSQMRGKNIPEKGSDW